MPSRTAVAALVSSFLRQDVEDVRTLELLERHLRLAEVDAGRACALACDRSARAVSAVRSTQCSSSRTLPVHSRPSSGSISSGGERRQLDPLLRGETAAEVMHELRNVAAPIPQRRQRRSASR